MDFSLLIIKNIFNIPLLCFFLGIFFAIIKPNWKIPSALNKILTLYILFCIGLKGGGPLAEHSTSSGFLFSMILGGLALWGLLNPLLSFYLLKSFTRVDHPTAAAIGASFGSVSVMTFVTAISFLDQLKINYQELLIAILALMEIPAIISGVFIAKKFTKNSSSIMKMLRESLFNKAILSIVAGMILGFTLYCNNLQPISSTIMISFKPLLCVFLLGMGLNVGLQRQ
jgi:hypothetical protein